MPILQMRNDAAFLLYRSFRRQDGRGKNRVALCPHIDQMRAANTQA
jgi:hypothetical protein